jgi:hypothetical protein
MKQWAPFQKFVEDNLEQRGLDYKRDPDIRTMLDSDPELKRKLLLLAGDVEKNPGPDSVTESGDED